MLRRTSAPHRPQGGIIVAIGYPLSDSVYSPRREFDLTPPVPPSHDNDNDQHINNTNLHLPKHGGADLFLDFILSEVKPFVRSAFPSIEVSEEALFGHSYGGLFCLHTLFTRPGAFDCYIAASPSIHWCNRFILSEEQAYREQLELPQRCSEQETPRLMLFFGSYEQDPPRWPGEPVDDYRKRHKAAVERGMKSNAIAMHMRLKESGKLASIIWKEYPEEDHGTVVACAVSRGLTTFFEERTG
ncbi:hypothetical protein FQN57_000116 [Myotisia sp. PD_48]|nr:hypothetical protein FQN57_000116 [Myotisia sp. PD_48]